MADNVIPLRAVKHLTIEVWEQKHGWLAEAHMNGELLWEFETDHLPNLMHLSAKTVGRLEDD